MLPSTGTAGKEISCETAMSGRARKIATIIAVARILDVPRRGDIADFTADRSNREYRGDIITIP
jgi:hypothetical protein